MELPKPAKKSSREGLGIVLVMGMTGAGKSTLISRLKTAGNQVQIGHGLESSKLATLTHRTQDGTRLTRSFSSSAPS